MNSLIKDVETAAFQQEVIERSFDVPVLVDFWAAWCGPCKVLGPTLERLVAEDTGSWELAKVDVDTNQEISGYFGVQGIPTVIAFRDGQPVDRFTGALSEHQVREFINKNLPSDLDLAAAQGDLLWEQGDDDAAESAFRSVLDSDATHQGAGLGLAGILVERGIFDDAVAVLDRLAPTEAVKQLKALARLGPSADLASLENVDLSDPSARLDYAKALSAASRHEEALEHLVELVGLRHPAVSEQARLTMLDLFDLLGPSDPLTSTFRRRLASALF